jgi:hypothetical protein
VSENEESEKCVMERGTQNIEMLVKNCIGKEMGTEGIESLKAKNGTREGKKNKLKQKTKNK